MAKNLRIDRVVVRVRGARGDGPALTRAVAEQVAAADRLAALGSDRSAIADQVAAAVAGALARERD